MTAIVYRVGQMGARNLHPNRSDATAPVCPRRGKRAEPVLRAPARSPPIRTAVRISYSRGFEFDFSRSCRFCFGQNQMQYPVPQGCLDLLAINGLRERKHALVIAVGVLVINPLVSGMFVDAAASADRQNPPFEGDIHPVGADAGHFCHHNDSIIGFVDVGRWQKYRPRRHALGAFHSCGCPLTDGSDCLGHDLTPSARSHAPRISIFFGRSASNRSNSTSNIPLLKRAWTLSGSTRKGSWTAREKAP